MSGARRDGADTLHPIPIPVFPRVPPTLCPAGCQPRQGEDGGPEGSLRPRYRMAVQMGLSAACISPSVLKRCLTARKRHLPKLLSLYRAQGALAKTAKSFVGKLLIFYSVVYLFVSVLKSQE